MRILICLLAFWTVALPNIGHTQNRAAIETDFRIWLQNDIWPRAQALGVTRQTFQMAFDGINLNWSLPDLVVPNAPAQTTQTQAEFRPPARYFGASGINHATNTGRNLLQKHATTLAQTTQKTGVPARILLAIWGRESSYGQADIPYDAFEILATKGFLSTRANYFTGELIAALQILEAGYATRAQMKSSWAGALGQPQFMPTNFLAFAADGDGDGRADIWRSQADTLASIGAYLQHFGWIAGRDWGFEVIVPNTISCALEGPDQSKTFQQWQSLGVTRATGRPFPAHELPQQGHLLMPAGRYGPAFIVTSNFHVLKDYNESDVYALFVGHVGDRIQYGIGDFHGSWARLDDLLRSDIKDLQLALEARGFDVGGADGLIGFRTRRSIGTWQTQNGEAATCYPDQTLIARKVQN